MWLCFLLKFGDVFLFGWYWLLFFFLVKELFVRLAVASRRFSIRLFCQPVLLETDMGYFLFCFSSCCRGKFMSSYTSSSIRATLLVSVLNTGWIERITGHIILFKELLSVSMTVLWTL